RRTIPDRRKAPSFPSTSLEHRRAFLEETAHPLAMIFRLEELAQRPAHPAADFAQIAIGGTPQPFFHEAKCKRRIDGNSAGKRQRMLHKFLVSHDLRH